MANAEIEQLKSQNMLNYNAADKLEMELISNQNTTSNVEEAQKSIQKVLDEKNLINEDLKGIEIDFNF